MNIDEIREKVHAVYARVPDINCKGLCTECCGLIDMSNAEKLLIEDVAGHLPGVDEHLTCTMLVDGRCSIYADRPLICRLWGAERSLPCPHGCKPKMWGLMGIERAMTLFNELDSIAGGMEPTQRMEELRELAESLSPDERRELDAMMRRFL